MITKTTIQRNTQQQLRTHKDEHREGLDMMAYSYQLIERYSKR